MKNRILTVVAVASLLSMSGCGQMRTFLFGRGARCGQGNLRLLGRNIRPFAQPSQVPSQIQQPYLPAPVAPYVQGPVAPVVPMQTVPGCQTCQPQMPMQPTQPMCNTCQPMVQAPMGCGVEAGCGTEVGCGIETLPNSCSCGNCGVCNAGVSSYGPATSDYAPVVDPYLNGSVGSGIVGSGQILGSGQVIGSYPVEGQIMGSYPVEGQIMGGSDWFPRASHESFKVDQDGHRIISEDPLPAGVTPLN